MQIPANQDVWEIVLKVASLIGSLATIILGVIAIALSTYFYRRSNDLFVALSQMLSRVEASSKTTEVTSTQVTSRLIDGVVGSLQKDTLSRAEHPAVLRMAERVNKSLHPLPREARQAIVKELRDELQELFSTLRAEASPATLDYDWGPFIRLIDELEGKHRFLSVKWLNQTKLAEDPALRESLQVAIEEGIVELYSVDNPKNPEFPTTACKLARENPVVKKVVGSSDKS